MARSITRRSPALSAINMRLRDDYSRDASGGVERWNKLIEKTGVSSNLRCRMRASTARSAIFAGKSITPERVRRYHRKNGSNATNGCRSEGDGDFIQSLMVPVYEPGKYAGWIAPPKVGIDNLPGDFEYVKLHMA